MKHLILFALFASTAVFASDPFACVEPGFRAAFVPDHLSPATSTYSTELPPGFLEHDAPQDSVLIGSQVNDSFASVVYDVNDDIDDAVDDVVSSLTRRGWKDIDRTPVLDSRGFRAVSMPRFSRLCNEDGPGLLNVNTREAAGRVLLTMTVMAAGGVGQCEAPQQPIVHHMALEKELPNLELPRGVRSTGSGSGGGGDEYETHVTIVTDKSLSSLVTSLNDQIRDQGWSYDASWNGQRSIGSTWFKESADGAQMVGTLQAFGSGNTHNLRFTILLAEANAQTAVFGIGQ